MSSKTAPSTPRLSEYARHFSYPSGIKRTVWPRVEAKGRELGLGFDWWQAQSGTVILGYGDDGKYCATVGGVGMSIPRQVGKTYFVLAMLVILCILYPGLQVVWTAHHLRTSTKTFTTLRGMARRKKIAPLIRSIRSANGEQEVVFVNGSRIMFGARSQGFGRGFDEIDVEVFDEAQILDTKALEDMVAATNQARHEHGALLIYMGTPPRPSDPSDAFTQRRAKAIAGKAPNAVWLEIGADPASDPDDRSQWPLMNPSFPIRTPVESMLRLRENLSDEDSWNREGRGIWDAIGLDPEFPVESWHGLTDPDPAHSPARMQAFAVEVDVDRTWASIGAAGKRADGRMQLEVVDRRRGMAWLVDRCVELNRDHGPVRFVIDGAGPAQSLEQPLKTAGLDVVVVGAADVASACAGIVDAVLEGTVAHGPDADLGAASAGCRRKVFRDGGFTFSRRNSTVDVTPLMAVTLARWIAVTAPPAPGVWSMSEIVENLRTERAKAADGESDDLAPTGSYMRPDGVRFTPL